MYRPATADRGYGYECEYELECESGGESDEGVESNLLVVGRAYEIDRGSMALSSPVPECGE